MSIHYKLIKDITPESKAWTAKITVAEKGMPRNSRNTSRRFQRLVLIDEERTQIQATIFSKDIDFFEKKLTALKSYYISNATVNTIEDVNKIVDNPYQWTINNYTSVEEVVHDNIPQLSSIFNIVPLSDLENHMNSQVDLIGVALEIQPPRDIHTRDGPRRIQKLLVVDQSCNPTSITIWNQTIDTESPAIEKLIESRPIIIATRLKVSSFNGISVQTKASTTFIINPEVPEARSLQSWFAENRTQFENISNRHYLKPNEPKAPSHEDIIPIDAIQTLDQSQPNFWLKANLSITNFYQSFWYMACNNCQKGTTSHQEDKFECQYCNKYDAVPTPRCRVEVQLKDKTGSIIAIISDNQAEKLISCTAKQLMETTSKNKNENINKIVTIPTEKEYIIYTKIFKNKLRGGVQHKFFINQILDPTTT